MPKNCVHTKWMTPYIKSPMQVQRGCYQFKGIGVQGLRGLDLFNVLVCQSNHPVALLASRRVEARGRDQ